MSLPRRDEGGIRRISGRVLAPPGSAAADEDWRGANEAKIESLRRNDLQRRARTGRLQLRHSDHGYALIDTERKPVNDRHNMTLDEIELLLDQAPER